MESAKIGIGRSYLKKKKKKKKIESAKKIAIGASLQVRIFSNLFAQSLVYVGLLCCCS